MRYGFYDDPDYKKKQSEITRKNYASGKVQPNKSPLENRICKNPTCNKHFKVKPWELNIYCSHSCSAKINNGKRGMKVSCCTFCGNKTARFGYKYCSAQCQADQQLSYYIKSWQLGEKSGSVGINTRTTSHYIRRYLNKKYGEKCSQCGWNQRNPITNKVPLEIDHIDGNSENNREENLRLICPNCHSLTASFRNLNKGKGRAWRLSKVSSLKLSDNANDFIYSF